MKDKEEFGKFIIKKRKENNLTQKELAEKLYVSESAVSKWERGLSYPDISLISSICDILKINEHELITASDDLHQQEIERNSMKLEKATRTYKKASYLIYGITLFICFICNIATAHTLSWFFIVLTSLAVVFSLTLLPFMFDKNRGFIALAGFFVTLNILLLTCCIYTNGNWFGITFSSSLLSFSIIFLPYILRNIELPGVLYSHKALACFFIDTLLLFVMLWTCCSYENYMSHFFTIVCPITLASILLPWMFLIVIRYTRVNIFFKSSICFALSAVYTFLLQSIITSIINHTSFALSKYNLNIWTNEYISGNINLVIAIVFLIIAAILSVKGVTLLVNKSENKSI